MATPTTTTTTTTATASASPSLPGDEGQSGQLLMATLELQYFKAASLYRRRNYEKCVELCNALLQAGQQSNVQIFTAPASSDTADVERDVVAGNAVALNARYNSHSHNRSNMSNMGSNSISRYGSNLQRFAARHNAPGARLRGGTDNSHPTDEVQATTNNGSRGKNNNKEVMPTWMMEGVWQLKMRALTQRVYIDDLETNDLANEGKFESNEILHVKIKR